MDDMQRSRAREEHCSGDYALDYSFSFGQSKRARLEDPPSKVEKENRVVVSNSSLLPLSKNTPIDLIEDMTSTTSITDPRNICPWRLPRNQTLTESQQCLNEQLQHAVVVSSMLLPRSFRTFPAQENEQQDDVERICTLDLTQVWELLAVGLMTQSQQQETAEKRLRDVLDLVSYLLYVRDRELEHQNGLRERLSKIEKQLERKNHIVHTLKTDLETLKQKHAQRENRFQAKEQVLMTERKTLQMEKKTLEVNCARLQGVETAYKAQLRRKDVDYARLRKRLQDVVSHAAKEKWGMAMTKPLNGVQERKQVSINNHLKEDKLTKQIMKNLERKKAELLLDNEALAKSYDTLQHHLESLTLQYKKAIRLFLAQKNLEGDAAELEKLASAPIDDFTPTPFNMATKASIPQFISQSMEALDEKLKQLEHVIRNELPSAEARSDKKVIKRLRQKLDDAHGIINEQDQLLQASLSAPVVDARVSRGASHQSITAEARVDDVAKCRSSPDASAEEDLAHEKSELAVLRQNLQKERKILQKQAVKLDKDRLEFEIIKRDLMFGSSMDASCERASPSISDGTATCSTPTRQHQAKRLKLDGPDSPIDIPVSATPGTAAYLKKIGIHVPSAT
ncbi:unnamed protein product [Peronospora destructor]|uniref:Uncharacterized protein n=1 Tax=Peronospora destructor TaxID=86335 RepID=A0AAV0UT16_9STRA|nr:unnamed protein product [Peronospora destructor]